MHEYPGTDRTLSISWSRLRTWEECRQKAHLQFLGKKNPTSNLRAFWLGTLADRVFRQWLMSDDPQPGQMVTILRERADILEEEAREAGDGVVKWKTQDDKANSLDWTSRLLVKLEVLAQELILPYEYKADYRFKAPITIPYLDGSDAEVLLIGAVDVLVTDPSNNNMHVWDLKATENNSYWRKTIGQLVFYDIGLGASVGRFPTITGLIQPMCKQQIIEADIQDAHRAQLMQNIVKYAHSVWSEDFRPKVSNTGCSFCPYKHACAKYKKVPGGIRL